jgi:hypothetical protein
MGGGGMVSLGKDEVKGKESRRLCSVGSHIGWVAGFWSGRPRAVSSDGRGVNGSDWVTGRDPREATVCDQIAWRRLAWYLDWTDVISGLKHFKHLIAPRYQFWFNYEG